VRAILALRHQEEDLQADAGFEVICSEPDRPFVYRRGDLLCAVNPSGRAMEVSLPAGVSGTVQGDILFEIGSSSLTNGKLTVGAQSFVVIR
jgi:maltose alpha-D-glucosyltransferase/alpha-amylase